VLVRFNQGNVWEIYHNKEEDKLVASYRKDFHDPNFEIVDIKHNEYNYRLWKTFTRYNDGYSFIPDAFPMIYYAHVEGYDLVKKVRETRIIFERVM
jgi:hypothetical protein